MIWDPLRKKQVSLTPEENVRQWCIKTLNNQMKVPYHMMMSEVGFRLGDKQMRADIVVYDRQAKPVLVVECKRPDVRLDREVLDQAICYNMVLDVRYILITNGTSSYIFKRGEKGFVQCGDFPEYEEILLECQQQ